MSNPEVMIEYQRGGKARLSLMDGMMVERGTKKDWDALHHLHYKAESLPIGPHFWRCVTKDGDLVGVVVTSVVSLLLAPRHVVLPKLKPGGDTRFSNQMRAKWLNKNMRRDARIVTDTLYRGVGVSYRMVNLVNRMEGLRFIEIQSSMSKFNPFDVKAGFRHATLKPANAYRTGIAFFRDNFESHPADHEAIMAEFDAMPQESQARAAQRTKEFYFRWSPKEKTGGNLGLGNERIAAMSFSQVLRELQQLVFATPVYGIWENPDVDREIPDRLPLVAFDYQGPCEKLNLDKVREYYEK